MKSSPEACQPAPQVMRDPTRPTCCGDSRQSAHPKRRRTPIPTPAHRTLLASVVLAVGACDRPQQSPLHAPTQVVEDLVRRHAVAWETGDTQVMREIIHDDALIARPGRRMGKGDWIRELEEFARKHTGTRVYVHRVIVDGSRFAVEWQFAATERASGLRTAVGDAIVGGVRDGRIVEWKEYLDGRVIRLQREGVLELDEGKEPFPWPSARREPGRP